MHMSAPPSLIPMAQVRCKVQGTVSLGNGPYGERRYVRLEGGTVEGPELNGRVAEGGIDWQTARDDGVLDIGAHYVIRTNDEELIEVHSTGLRHGPQKIITRLERGEHVSPTEYFFRTVMRFTTGASALAHLNKLIAIAVGQREANLVILDVYRLT